MMVEKAVIERSGATGEGLTAIIYMGQRYGWNAGSFVKMRGQRYDGAGA